MNYGAISQPDGYLASLGRGLELVGRRCDTCGRERIVIFALDREDSEPTHTTCFFCLQETIGMTTEGEAYRSLAAMPHRKHLTARWLIPDMCAECRAEIEPD